MDAKRVAVEWYNHYNPNNQKKSEVNLYWVFKELVELRKELLKIDVEKDILSLINSIIKEVQDVL